MNPKSIEIPLEHPTFIGHFPGNPVLPGVSILDLVVETFGQAVHGISNAKFLKPVKPGDTLTILIDEPADGVARFAVMRAKEVVCEGCLVPGNTDD